jgi:excinuclease ABC subunit C
MDLSQRLPTLPARPGVYLFKDASGTVIYVGKAASLRNRVRSYFAASAQLPPKIGRMVAQVNDLEVIIADSEQDALLMECNLIKRYRPRYNARLKDDKSFPYLKIDLGDEWPRVCITRRWEKGKGRYFGPYANAGSVRRTLALLQRLFPFRSCSRIPAGIPRACLDYHIHRCVGPCIGAVTREEYAHMIHQVILFLEGRQEKVVGDLKRQMAQAAADLDFEKAALLRNQIQAIQQVIEGQKLATAVRGDLDAIAFVQNNDLAYIETFFIRNGKLTGRDHFLLEGIRDMEPEEILASFVKQFYLSATFIPPVILLPEQPAEPSELEEWLKAKKGARVRLQTPARGQRRKLLEMVIENARQGWEQFQQKHITSAEALATAMAELRDRLHLPATPERMECYDISNILGASAVGSMVVFEKGLPKPAHYRRFRIKTVERSDDYAMLQEVLRRRFKRADQPADTVQGESWSTRPDLVIVDGGKGQLHAAETVLYELGLAIPAISIAKEREEIFIPGQSEPVALPPTAPASQMIQRIRDEAHRFAISYHTRVRTRISMASALDDIPGIGPKRKRALLRQFGTIKGIKEASTEAIATAATIRTELAEKIKASL